MKIPRYPSDGRWFELHLDCYVERVMVGVEDTADVVAVSHDRVCGQVRRLIEVAAPGGGFMLDLGAVMHQGKDENLMAMMEAAREYGVYGPDPEGFQMEVGCD